MKRIIFPMFMGALLALNPLWATASTPSNKHQQFIKKLVADANDTNGTILQQRQHLLSLEKKEKKGNSLSSSDKTWVLHLAAQYKVRSIKINQPTSWNPLLKRVDVIPPSLLVAQAVNESGWGTSHVAKVAHNYFGQTCYSPRCGTRVAHSRHQAPAMKAFHSQKESVNSYINNLNTNQAYASMREIRWHARTAKQSVKGLTLAEGLTRYSERGHAYISTIKTIIRNYHLSNLDDSLDVDSA